jgi:TM2 domain-containing membrane protein YozV
MDEPDFDRGTGAPKDDFEQRFLEFAYSTTVPINAPAVAHALKIPIATAAEKLEDLAASDVLIRIVDNEGMIFYRLPGRVSAAPNALVKANPPGPLAVSPPPHPQAMAGLLLNLVVPGVGSIVAGKTVEGIIQLVLLVIGLPLCFVLIGIPLCIAVWGWALATGLRALNESHPRSNSVQ